MSDSNEDENFSDYDREADDVEDYENTDEEYDGPEVQVVTEVDHLLPEREYCIRCQNCQRAFHAVSIPQLPPMVPGKEEYYCCWGFFRWDLLVVKEVKLLLLMLPISLIGCLLSCHLFRWCFGSGGSSFKWFC